MTTLDYAQPPRRRWLRTTLKVSLWSALLFVVVAAGLRWVLPHLQVWQQDRDLVGYVLAPGTLVYSDDPADFATTPTGMGRAHSKMVDQAGNQLSVSHMPGEQMTASARAGPAVRQRTSYYLGVRDAGAGERVVLVGPTAALTMRLAFPDNEPGGFGWDDLYAQVYRPTGLVINSSVLSDVEHDVLGWIETPPARLRIVAGGSDPDDPAAFSFRFTTDHDRGGVVGRLLPDDTVSLEVVDRRPLDDAADD